ncbi:MAG: DNA primase, partial [Rhodospirillaceae bacterium]
MLAPAVVAGRFAVKPGQRMAFSEQFLDELRGRVGLADVVGRRVKLTRKGREHSGLCPFHKEKTPSFTVNEEKGFYHCFGCQAHGSVFDFVMETEGLSFPEAVERLAVEAGMEVPRDTPEDRVRQKQRQTLFDVTEAAAVAFEKALRMPEGRVAREYLAGRGLDEATVTRFRLGFAPAGRTWLRTDMARANVEAGPLVAAGLLIQPDSGEPYDRFRGRVMFPITDRRGRVIAFGGRILGDGEPKYLNSPETPLFHKGNNLYGLHLAGLAARQADRLIVTEGYMDVIALAQAGFAEAVAPLGTALTEDQIALLWKVVREPVLCFDGDAAGQRAATKAAGRALSQLKPGYGLRFAILPTGEDPDSLVQKRGAAAMQAL